MAVTVFWCSVAALEEPGRYERLLQRLPEERKERTERLRRPADRWRSVAGWLMFETAMRSAGIPQERWQFRYGVQGKPYLGLEDLQFSISHSGPVALCAVSAQELGADVQQPARWNERLVRRVCTAGERAWLETQPQPAQAFFRLWTRKESLVKACGLGIGCGLDTICCLPEEETVFQNARWYFYEQQLAGCPACVCTGEPGLEIRWREQSLGLL